MTDDSIRPFYADWAGYNRRIVEGLSTLSPDDLALRVAGSEHWPVWAIAGHMAATRVFWLCEVFGEPGRELTPFADSGDAGWEDDLSRPRSGAELAGALASTWQIVDACLTRWTPAVIDERFDRLEDDRHEVHTRQSILMRLINHEAYHLGEINLALGVNGRQPINLWPSSDWSADAPRARREA